VSEKLKTRLRPPGYEAALRQLVKTFKVYEHAHKDLNKPPFILKKLHRLYPDTLTPEVRSLNT